MSKPKRKLPRKLGRKMVVANKLSQRWRLLRNVSLYALGGIILFIGLSLFFYKLMQPTILVCIPSPVRVEDRLMLGMICGPGKEK